MSLSLAAARISIGGYHFYIPAAQVQRCVLVADELPGIPRLSQWLGLPEEPQVGMHLHLFVPQSAVEQGWYFWGELENVVLHQGDILPLPVILQRCCQLPGLRAMVKGDAFSPLLSW